jgi:hypothetical protein
MDVTMVKSQRSSPVRVRDVLVAAVPELRDRLIESAIARDWSQVVGSELGRRSRSGRLRGGSLDVTVDNSPLLHEMTLRSGELLVALQARFPGSLTALRFTLGAQPSTPAQPAPRPRIETRLRLSPDEAREVEAVVATVSDPAVAGSLRRLLTKDVLARRRPGPPHHRHEGTRPVEREGT